MLYEATFPRVLLCRGPIFIKAYELKSTNAAGVVSQLFALLDYFSSGNFIREILLFKVPYMTPGNVSQIRPCSRHAGDVTERTAARLRLPLAAANLIREICQMTNMEAIFSPASSSNNEKK